MRVYDRETSYTSVLATNCGFDLFIEFVDKKKKYKTSPALSFNVPCDGISTITLKAVLT